MWRPLSPKGFEMEPTNTATREEHEAVYRLIMAGWGTQVTRTLAFLSVAEHFEAGPLTARQIADRLSSDPDMTFRLLRAATAMGYLAFDPDTSQFSGTAMLDVLRGDSALSLKHYALTAASEVFWLPSLRLTDTVLQGRNHAEEVLGCTPFEYFAEREPEARIFSFAMTELSTPVINEAVAAIDIGEAQLAVDVGGADGAFVARLLERHPELRGVVLDLPQVMAGVAEEARRRGLAGRMTGTPGDFFEQLPSADLYLLKFVLHDWDDVSCQRILSNIRRAMNPGARLIIVEMMADTGTLEASLMDIAMMFAFTGQERDEPHFASLLSAAGLRTSRTAGLHHPYRLIEAVAA
jgi:SAM-dependent methyltransferase